jgi:hypothetical protein
MKMAVFWDVVPYSLIDSDRCFRGHFIIESIIDKIMKEAYDFTWILFCTILVIYIEITPLKYWLHKHRSCIATAVSYFFSSFSSADSSYFSILSHIHQVSDLGLPKDILK